MFRATALFMAAALAVGANAVPAAAADLQQTYREVHSGVCAQPKYLRKIVDKFAYQVRHVPNLPDVGIREFVRIRENRYEPMRERWPIGRRYCEATAAFTDGRQRQVWYLIEEDMGFASIGSNVEFCVAGFDRWMVYNGGCRVLR